MGYPISIPSLSFTDSINLIAVSEASVLQNLNQILCNDFVTPILADTITNATDRLNTMAQVLNNISCKECSMSKVLSALSSLIVVENNIPTGVNSSSSNSSSSSCSAC